MTADTGNPPSRRHEALPAVLDRWQLTLGDPLPGDFFDKNVLLGATGYVAIDPMPCIGDPCSDVGFFASYHPPARSIATRARAIASLLGYDTERAERAERWAAVWAVGEACETWREDSEELQSWMSGPEAERLLAL